VKMMRRTHRGRVQVRVQEWGLESHWRIHARTGTAAVVAASLPGPVVSGCVGWTIVRGGWLEQAGRAGRAHEFVCWVTLHQLVGVRAAVGGGSFARWNPCHSGVLDCEVVVGLGLDQFVRALVAVLSTVRWASGGVC
jgi:hypothetical protein